MRFLDIYMTVIFYSDNNMLSNNNFCSGYGNTSPIEKHIPSTFVCIASIL